MDPETARHLLEQKISLANTAGNVSMLWWVTSIVFCVSVLAGVWKNKESFIKRKSILSIVGLVGLGFFLLVILYGCSVINYLDSVQREISELSVPLSIRNDFFSPEVRLFRRAMQVGTLSFVGVLILWIAMCIWLLFGKWEQSNSENTSLGVTHEASNADEPTEPAPPNKSFEPTAS